MNVQLPHKDPALHIQSSAQTLEYQSVFSSLYYNNFTHYYSLKDEIKALSIVKTFH